MAKTDRLDAQVLARYGAAFDCPAGRRDQDADEAGRVELRDLLRRREQLVKQRVQERNRLDNDSGRRRGHRSIRGGRGPVRRVLYMASQSAARHHPELKAFYQGLCQRGKARKGALVAVMRKLLLQVNAVSRRGTPWMAEYAPAA